MTSPTTPIKSLADQVNDLNVDFARYCLKNNVSPEIQFDFHLQHLQRLARDLNIPYAAAIAPNPDAPPAVIAHGNLTFVLGLLAVASRTLQPASQRPAAAPQPVILSAPSGKPDA